MWSEGKANAWFSVDLKDHRFLPTHYAYRGDFGGGENHPRNWQLQGSEDGEKFYTLSQHKEDQHVHTPTGQKALWNISGGSKFWRFFRILNMGRPKHLCCSGIEFYGTLEKTGQKFVPDESKLKAIMPGTTEPVEE